MPLCPDFTFKVPLGSSKLRSIVSPALSSKISVPIPPEVTVVSIIWPFLKPTKSISSVLARLGLSEACPENSDMAP